MNTSNNNNNQVGGGNGEVNNKILYIVVIDDVEKKLKDDNKGKESFRYTRSVLQSTLQLMGCKARHAFKVFIFFFLYILSLLIMKNHCHFVVHGFEILPVFI
jgi:hypothetical protein